MVLGTLREIFILMKYVREKPIIFSDAEFNSVHDGLLQFNRTYFGENKKKYFL
jgi:hypothetical protein